MYKITKDGDGVALVCHDCSHVERVNSFDERLGSRRTQAARAMQSHSRDKHGKGSVLSPVPKNYGAIKQSHQKSGISRDSY
jgi:ribosome-binding protein aMBF1 (putative translation factor)